MTRIGLKRWPNGWGGWKLNISPTVVIETICLGRSTEDLQVGGRWWHSGFVELEKRWEAVPKFEMIQIDYRLYSMWMLLPLKSLLMMLL